MIVTPHFCYIHLHKTGGTFLNECLLQHIEGARLVGYHLPRRLLPPEASGLPVLGFVRNPWSYYVSWFHFQSSRPMPNALFNVCSDYGRRGFFETVRNLLNLGSGSALLDEILALLPNVYVERGLNVPRFALADIRDSGLGFFSFLYRYMYAGPGSRLYLGRNECLSSDFLGFLRDLGIPHSTALEAHITTGDRRNASEHAPYQAHYDSELRELVALRDTEIIARHGYQF